MKKIFRTFVYGNFFVSLCTVALAYEAYLQEKIKPDLNYLLFIFCSTLFLYNFQRILFAKKFFTTSISGRHQWIVANRKALIVISALSFSGMIFTVYFFSFKNLVMLSLTGILSLAYFIPGLSLRKIPGIKASMVAGVWTLVTCFFPLYFSFVSVHSLIYICMERFLFMLPLCIVFNIRDVEFDKSSGVKTLPVIFGAEKTKRFCILLLCGFIALVCRNGLSPVSASLAFSAVITGIMIWKIKPDSGEMYYSFFLEGTMLLQALLVLAAVCF